MCVEGRKRVCNNTGGREEERDVIREGGRNKRGRAKGGGEDGEKQGPLRPRNFPHHPLHLLQDNRFFFARAPFGIDFNFF